MRLPACICVSLLLTVFASCAKPNVGAADSTAAVQAKRGADESREQSAPRSQEDTSVPDEMTPSGDDSQDAAEIFARRMLPIAQSSERSSCTECHFGGVELRNYIHEDQETTFVALRDDGLIDVGDPDKSKILTFIGRHTAETDPLVAKVRKAELQAFRSWIRAAVKDPELRDSKAKSTARVRSELPVEVVRHMRRDSVVKSFVENIWLEMGRCVNCHSPERNKRLIKEHGEQISWLVPKDPAATLKNLVDGGNIDTDDPEQSMLLLKPLGIEDHGGGPKFAPGSRTDKNFRGFLNDYAAVVNEKYRNVDQLPKPTSEVAALSDQQLRIVDLPEGLDGKLLKADIFPWSDGGWSKTPSGSAENPINAERKMWQSMVSVVAQRGTSRADELRHENNVRLPAGRYLIRIYIDQKGAAEKDRDRLWTDDDLHAEVEIDGEWQPGYQPPKIISAADK